MNDLPVDFVSDPLTKPPQWARAYFDTWNGQPIELPTHFPKKITNGEVCAICAHLWPCDVSMLQDYVVRLKKQLETPKRNEVDGYPIVTGPTGEPTVFIDALLGLPKERPDTELNVCVLHANMPLADWIRPGDWWIRDSLDDV